MCNAWNHPANCRCGFGGEGHTGRRPQGSVTHRFAYVPVILPAYESYVNPNAKCPVCGAAVFFYQSPDGGRVFFDELGPPWSKHPCTDHRSIPRKLDYSGATPSANTPTWEREGWIPLFIDVITDRDRHAYEISGMLDGLPIKIYIRKKADIYMTSKGELTRNSIMYLRKNENNCDELSLMLRSGRTITTGVYYRLSEAHEASKTLASRRMAYGANTRRIMKNSNVFIGRVKWFDVNRGYGVIEPSDGSVDIFVHISDLKDSGVTALRKGQRVRTTVRESHKGRKARSIKLL